MADFSTTALAAMMLIIGPRFDLPPEQIQARFEQLCVDGKWHDDCPGLRMELEVKLYGELHELYMNDEPLDRQTLRVASKATFPYLAAFAIQRIGAPQSQEDEDAILAALEHPAPGVGDIARGRADLMGDAWREGLARWWAVPNTLMAPRVRPDMARRKLPALNGEQFRYRFLASNRERAVFTTKLAPEMVLDLVAKGQPVVTGDKLAEAQATVERLQKQPVNDSKEMQNLQDQLMAAYRRGDMKAAQELGQRIKIQANAQVQRESAFRQASDLAAIKPVTQFSIEPSQVRYVKLKEYRSDEEEVYVAAGYDGAWGETAVVVVIRCLPGWNVKLGKRNCEPVRVP